MPKRKRDYLPSHFTDAQGLSVRGVEPLIVRLNGARWFAIAELLKAFNNTISRATKPTQEPWYQGFDLWFSGAVAMPFVLGWHIIITRREPELVFYGVHAGRRQHRSVEHASAFRISRTHHFFGNAVHFLGWKRYQKRNKVALSHDEMMIKLKHAIKEILSDQTNLDQKSLNRIVDRLLVIFGAGVLTERRAMVLLNDHEPWVEWKERKANVGRGMDDYIRVVFADALAAEFNQRDFRTAFPTEFWALKTWCRRHKVPLRNVLPRATKVLDEAIAEFGVHSYANSVALRDQHPTRNNEGRAFVYEGLRRRRWSRANPRRSKSREP